MKKLLLSFMALLSIGTASQAQMRYSFTTQTGQAYTPLTGATDIAGYFWDEPSLSAPIGFSFDLNGKTTNQIYVQSLNYIPFILSDSVGGAMDSLNGFMAMEADLWDRGNADTSAAAVPMSPINYVVSGTAPSRIFKLEFRNAGFYEDTTGVDSVSFQVWMYEGSNIVELRYGPSRLTTANLPTYFYYGGSGPLAGVVNRVAAATVAGKVYHLKGNPASPTIDSVELTASSASTLSSYPANGTVYRFTPNATGVELTEATAAARALKLYPSAATSAINVEWSGADGEAYQILSATGQQVSAGRLRRGTQAIPVSALATGTYHLRLAAGSHQFVKQ